MKKEKIRTIIKRTKNSKIKTKSKPDNPTKTINYDFTLLNEIFKGVEDRKFISTELKRIAEEYKISESTVALYAGKRFIWQGYCSKESGYALEKLEGDELLDEIMNIADSKESEKEFDWKPADLHMAAIRFCEQIQKFENQDY